MQNSDRQELRLRFFRQICLIRAFEEQVAALALKGIVPGFVHLSIGQEAVATGVCHAMAALDYLFTAHRAHGHLLARGSDPYRVLAEILGKADGCCQGRGGSMHLADMGRRIVGATGVVGGNLPLALGSAWAARERGEQAVAVVFFGDGATSAGSFHETLNLAALWQIPVLLVCENNGYAEFTARDEHSVVQSVTEFARPFGVPALRMDAVDVEAVYDTAARALEQVRGHPGPYLLEFLTQRMAGHYVGDPDRYRSLTEKAEWQARDPLHQLRRRLSDGGQAAAELDAIAGSIRDQVREWARLAVAAPFPAPDDPCAFTFA